ncbi:MAG: cytidine deaminase [Deltaproteobacteria bacterium]|nr:cytidine deaminase [Deltaproteobacteria bacterium]
MKRPSRAALFEELTAAALCAQKHAYAPYSRFRVGSAVWALNTKSGEERLFAGANVENASFGLALCAERNAIASAISEGFRELKAIAIATGSQPPGSPCGLCLQTMVEFAVDLDVILLNTHGDRHKTKLSQLIKRPFRWKGAGTERDAR